MQNYIAFDLADGDTGRFRKDFTIQAEQLANVPASEFMRLFLPEYIYSSWINDCGILFDSTYGGEINKDDIFSSFEEGTHIINFLV